MPLIRPIHRTTTFPENHAKVIPPVRTQESWILFFNKTIMLFPPQDLRAAVNRRNVYRFSAFFGPPESIPFRSGRNEDLRLNSLPIKTQQCSKLFKYF